MKHEPRKRYPRGLEDYELKQLRKTMTFAVRAIQRACPMLSRNKPGFLKREALALFRTSMKPFRGRPQDETITAVIGLKSSGLTWKEAAREVIPGFSECSRLHQMDTIRRIQSARRRRNQTARKNVRETDGQNIQALDVSAMQETETPTESEHEGPNA